MSIRGEAAGRLVFTVILLTGLFLLSCCQQATAQGLKLSLIEVVNKPVPLTVDQSRNISLVPGRSYNITCNRDGGFGMAADVWLQNGNPVQDRTRQTVQTTMPSVYTLMLDSNNWVLVLQMFRETDAATYTCRRAGSNVTLVIGTNNPVVIASTPQQPISTRDAGRRLSLIAFVSGSPQPAPSEITWYFNNNQSLPTDAIPQGSELLLPRPVLPEHAGTYTIQVATQRGTARDSFQVTVTAQPAPTLSPSETQVGVSGNSITLTCEDSTGVPPPTFSWSRADGVPLDNSRHIISNSTEGSVSRSTLIISPLVSSDTGQYQCTARNSDGFSIVPVSVQVQFGPILEPFSTKLRWVVGMSAILQTRLVSANPNTNIGFRWLNPSGGVIPRSQYFTSMRNGSVVYEVTLPQLTSNSGGTYTCVVWNNISRSSQTFDLVITIPPTLFHISGSTGRRTMLARNGGVQVMLTANVNGSRPDITADQVSWTNGGGPIQESAKYITTVRSTQVNLTITTLTMDDSGLYTVTIAHEAGTVSLEFQLEVLDPPAPPTNIRVNPVSACIVDIDWETSPTSDPGTAVTSYVIIEATLTEDGSSGWEHVGRAQERQFQGRIPLGGINTTYWLRARSGNIDVGEGSNYREPTQFTAYPQDSVPFPTEVSGAASTDSETIQVGWSVPAGDCFVFSSFTISCVPLEGGATPTSTGQNMVGGGLRSALVRDLAPNTFHSCSVESHFDGFDLSTTTYASRAIFTFPLKPSAPGVKLFAGMEPTSETVTVQFTLPQDHQNISHYRVYALRLPSSSPSLSVFTDDLFKTPGDSRLSTYEVVNEPDPFDDEKIPYLGYIVAEVAASGFKPLFTVGDGSQTDIAQFSNGKLRPSSIYAFFLRAYPKTRGDFPSFRTRRRVSSRQYVVFSSSDLSRTFKTEAAGPAIGGNSPSAQEVAIGVVIAVVLFMLVCGIVILLVCIFVIRSARSRTYKPDPMPSINNSSSSSNGTLDFIVETPDLGRVINGGGHELKQLEGQFSFLKSSYNPSGPISLEEFPEHVEAFDSNRQLLFQEEYDWISSNSPWNPAVASNHHLNDEKNRYSNITAFDHSRVELELQDGRECSDYINANFIAGYHSEQEYIATQGPLEQTVVDFWRMIWEQNSATIIMLTNLVELGKVKCSQYWPSSDKLCYGNIMVTLESTVTLPDYTIRKLTIENMARNQSRTVLQFHYTRWPDYHTPQLAAPLLNFLRAANTSNPEKAGPMVVHCSAGVGRSGTVIAIDYCLHQLKADGIIDIRGYVSRMREQRNYMVQTAEQYKFIHYAILESITYGDTSFALMDFKSLYEKLREVNPDSKKTLMDEEYSRLGQVKTMVKKSAFQRRLRRKGEPPRHFESSFRGTLPSTDSTDNYSGHFVDSYFEKKRFIIAEGPQTSTTAKFWQVVWDEDCSLVVMLTPKDSAQLYPYWPVAGEQVQHGNVIVQVERETEEHLYTRREIKLTNAKVGGISHTLEQYQFVGWTEDDFPRVPDFVKFVCDVLDGIQSTEGNNKKTLIHDTDSLGPASIMCALCYCVERLNNERMVDIFQAVQGIQLQRPGSIMTMKQYAFTYDCVYEYIRTRCHYNS